MFSGLFNGGRARKRRADHVNNVRSFVALVHMCCRSMVTYGVNVAGVGFLPSVTIFGHALGVPARGGGLKVTRGSHYGGVLMRLCKLDSSFFGRVSNSVGGGYGGMGSIGACLFVFRKFDGSLVVLVNGLVR